METIKEAIDAILAKFNEYSKLPFTSNPMRTLLCDTFIDSLKNEFPELRDKTKYYLQASIGKSKYAQILWALISYPWITKSAQHGVYVLFLVSSDGNHFYLSLGQGSAKKSPKELSESAKAISNLVDCSPFSKNVLSLGPDLKGNSENKKHYENGCICYKQYDKGNVPNDLILKNDIQRMINIYSQYNEVFIKGGAATNEGKTNSITDISKISDYILKKGFSYPKGFVQNFYLCLKSKPFVILAGVSGTGKTKLANLFAEAVGATADNGRFKLVPVRPDWSDSSELIGHKDLNGNFQPGLLLTFLEKAQKDKNNPYFFCLDEMNLARVEYYFSDVLSIMETRRFSTDGLSIVTNKIVDENLTLDKNSNHFHDVIVPDNVYFIGTVNMDETTFPFSKKVLDRANMIEFSDIDLSVSTLASSTMESSTNTAIKSADKGETPAASAAVETIASTSPLIMDNSFLKANFLTIKDCLTEPNIIGYCNTLEAINQKLEESSNQVGYRVRDEICFYLINNEKLRLLTDDEAMDNEIMQKILPRIQGSSSRILETLADLFEICVPGFLANTGIKKDNSSALFNQMKTYIDSSSGPTILPIKYPRSAKKICFMTQRYSEDDFTSYWL